jgi:hypothetical protein
VCTNDVDPEADQIHNPGGIVFAAWSVDIAGQMSAAPIVRSDGTWKCLSYPSSVPGMTVGEVIRHCVTEAQGRGGLAGLTLNFSDELDAEGSAWETVCDISTKVGTDYGTFFLKELCETYCDLWMEPAGWRLWAWVADGRGVDSEVTFHGPTDPGDPYSGNLTALTHRRAL